MITFQPNCSFPDTKPTGFVNSCGIRNTLDIAWSCIGIIILSTWSVLHLTVSADLDPKSDPLNPRLKIFFPDLRKKLEKFGSWCSRELYSLERKLIWMLIMLMFPEYLLSIGVANLWVACLNNRVLQPKFEDEHRNDYNREEKLEWSMKHTVLADIGGIAIRFPPKPKETDEHSEEIGYATSSGEKGRVSFSERADAHVSTDIISTSSQVKSISVLPPPERNPREEVHEFLSKFQKRQNDRFGHLGQMRWKQHVNHMKLVRKFWTTKLEENEKEPGSDIARWILTKIGLGDKLLSVTSMNHLSPFHGDIWILDSNQLMIARDEKIIQNLPVIRLAQIDDKNKSDGLVRLLAVTQILWLVVQLIARLIRQVPAALLEINTLAFAVCAIFTYLVEWFKTKDMAVPFYIDGDPDYVTQKSFDRIVKAAPNVFGLDRFYTMPQSCVHKIYNTKRDSDGVDLDPKEADKRAAEKNLSVDRLIAVLNIITTILFGGIHLLAWNFEFPTTIERMLWRASSLSVTAIPSICALLVLLEIEIYGTSTTFSVLSAIFFAVLYVLSRCYLIIESLRELYFLPPGALAETWATYYPHVS